MLTAPRSFFALAFCALFAACGGGNGGSSSVGDASEVAADTPDDSGADAGEDIDAAPNRDAVDDAADAGDVDDTSDADDDVTDADDPSDADVIADVPDTSDTDGDVLDATDADDADVAPMPLTLDDFSYVARAAIDAMEEDFADEEGATWSYGADLVLAGDYVIQTPPESHWGAPAMDMALADTCDPESAGCDPDFGLVLCDTQEDCTTGVCSELAATVSGPGQSPRSVCAGHSEFMLDAIYSTIVRAESFVDFTTLAPPDGRFTAAIRNAIGVLSHGDNAVNVRILFGNIITQEVHTEEVMNDLTAAATSDTPITVTVGAYRIGVDSWNHAKIIAVDGTYLLEGGHNFWTGHYLEQSPVHDISLQMAGSAAGDAHRFANRMWDYACEDHTFTGWTSRHEFPGGSEDCPPEYTETAPSERLVTGTRYVSMGRLGDLGANAPDGAILEMLASANESIRMSLQDLGPVMAGPITIGDWPQDTLREMVRAVFRGVDVYVVLSNPGSTPGGLGGGSNTYGNGWTAQDVVEAVEAYLEDHPSEIPPDTNVRDTMCERLHVGLLRFSDEDTYPDDANIGNHAKFFIVDDIAFYTGSQNLYEANLAEFGVVIDDVDATAQVLAEYWNPMWEQTSRVAVTGSDASMCVWGM